MTARNTWRTVSRQAIARHVSRTRASAEVLAGLRALFALVGAALAHQLLERGRAGESFPLVDAASGGKAARPKKILRRCPPRRLKELDFDKLVLLEQMFLEVAYRDAFRGRLQPAVFARGLRQAYPGRSKMGAAYKVWQSEVADYIKRLRDWHVDAINHASPVVTHRLHR